MGSCDFGDSCYKLHVMPDPSSSRPTHSTTDDDILLSEAEPVQICEYFHRGKCTYGDRCVKSHDPLPLYKKDLKDMVLRTAAEVAAEKKAAGAAAAAAAPDTSKVKTELVKIVKNRAATTARQPNEYLSSSVRNTYGNSNSAEQPNNNYGRGNTATFLKAGVSKPRFMSLICENGLSTHLGYIKGMCHDILKIRVRHSEPLIAPEETVG